MASRPLIGITLDSEPPGTWSAYPWYALRENYASAIASAGGLPVALSHEIDVVDATLDAIDALVVTGGAFDVDPALYGETDRHPTVALKSRRTQAEMALLTGAMARKLPVLGICGGMQLLAIALGGTLIQHIPDHDPSALPHEQPNPRHEAGHVARLLPGTHLERIVNKPELSVNSSHHQAVRDPGRGRVNAVAPDGIIEGIETVSGDAIGVQWHPEFLIDDGDRKLFDALVAHAGRRS